MTVILACNTCEVEWDEAEGKLCPRCLVPGEPLADRLQPKPEECHHHRLTKDCPHCRQAPKHGYIDKVFYDVKNAWEEWVREGRPDGGLTSWQGIPLITLHDYDKRYKHLLADAVARQAGVNIDGSSRRETVEVKDTNPKDAVGIRKAPLSVVPLTVVSELGLAMMEGALKYGRHNYRTAGVRASVYIDASYRHQAAFWEGEDIDPDSGLSHITKAIASLTVLRDSMIQGNWVDDRPPRSPDGWMKKLNTHAAGLLEKTPNPAPAHLEKR